MSVLSFNDCMRWFCRPRSQLKVACRDGARRRWVYAGSDRNPLHDEFLKLPHAGFFARKRSSMVAPRTEAVLHPLHQFDILQRYLAVDPHIEVTCGAHFAPAVCKYKSARTTHAPARGNRQILKIVDHVRIDIECPVWEGAVVKPRSFAIRRQMRNVRQQPLVMPLAPIRRHLIAQGAAAPGDA